MIAPIDDPAMSDFMAQLDEINSLADNSPGFVWRLQGDDGNATYLRPFDDDRILVNMSVWESIEHLKDFTYRTAHNEVMRRRREWFEKMDGFYLVLWWIKAGYIPTVAEARSRLEHLQSQGETPFAFTFKQTFTPADCREEDFAPPALAPCA